MIYRTFHLIAAEFSFFLGIYRTCSRIDHMLLHKKNLNTFKKTEMKPSSFSNHNGIKLKINSGSKTGKFTHTRNLNNMILNNKE